MDRLSIIWKVIKSVEFSIEEKVKFLISISAMAGGRRVLCVRGKRKMLSHVIWNLYNPNNKVKAGEHVHHENEDILDDRIGNYKKLSNVGHGKEHYEKVKKKHGGEHPLHSPEAREKAASRLRGRKYSKEHIAKVAAANRGRKHTAQARANMSKAHLGQKPTTECLAKRSISIRADRALKLKWSPLEALELRKMRLSKREIGRRLGVSPSNIHCYFKLRGVSY